jgi:hypothetical protein
MQIVTRGDIIHVLEAWQAGTIGPRDVHEWAEERYASSNFETEDDVATEVLSNLDCLDINLTTLEDAPTFLRMLRLPHDQPQEAFALLREHSDSIDIDERMRRYATDRFYGRFCGTSSDDPAP